MVILKQESAARKTLIEFNKAMRNRILKILAEPLTNADQVYKDMILDEIEPFPDVPKPIFIYVNRQTKEFSIVDYGKSMNREELIDRYNKGKLNKYECGG